MARHYVDPNDAYYDGYEDDYGIDFAEPGSGSALRAATASDPRNQPCPSCGEENRLTTRDKNLGYQCDSCADEQLS